MKVCFHVFGVTLLFFFGTFASGGKTHWLLECRPNADEHGIEYHLQNFGPMDEFVLCNDQGTPFVPGNCRIPVIDTIATSGTNLLFRRVPPRKEDGWSCSNLPVIWQGVLSETNRTFLSISHTDLAKIRSCNDLRSALREVRPWIGMTLGATNATDHSASTKTPSSSDNGIGRFANESPYFSHALLLLQQCQKESRIRMIVTNLSDRMMFLYEGRSADGTPWLETQLKTRDDARSIPNRFADSPSTGRLWMTAIPPWGRFCYELDFVCRPEEFLEGEVFLLAPSAFQFNDTAVAIASFVLPWDSLTMTVEVAVPIQIYTEGEF